HHDLPRGSTRRKGELDSLDPLGSMLGSALLEEGLALGTVHVTLEHDWSSGDAAQRPLGDRGIVLHEVELGVTGLGKEDLVGVGDHDLAAGNRQHSLARLAHWGSVARSREAAQGREVTLFSLDSFARAAVVVSTAALGRRSWVLFGLPIGRNVATPPRIMAASAIARRLPSTAVSTCGCSVGARSAGCRCWRGPWRAGSSRTRRCERSRGWRRRRRRHGC